MARGNVVKSGIQEWTASNAPSLPVAPLPRTNEEPLQPIDLSVLDRLLESHQIEQGRFKRRTDVIGM